MTLDIEAIKADREAGTKTEWKFETVKTSCGVCHKIGPFKYNNGKETSACVYEDYPWSTPHEMSEPETNARRIARVPELEAAVIAAGALAEAFQDCLDDLSSTLHGELDGVWDQSDFGEYLYRHEAALAAYREATQ